MSTGLQHDRAGLARAALAEVTDAGDVGDLVAVEEPAEGVVDLRFASLLPGYPDWRWAVSTAAVGDEPPTVLEVGLLPGDGALLAPPWVPWTERLAEWRRSHADEAGADDAADPDEDLDDEDLDQDVDDEDDEDLDDEADELDEDVDDRDGDIDGVDVEALVEEPERP